MNSPVQIDDDTIRFSVFRDFCLMGKSESTICLNAYN